MPNNIWFNWTVWNIFIISFPWHDSNKDWINIIVRNYKSLIRSLYWKQTAADQKYQEKWQEAFLLIVPIENKKYILLKVTALRLVVLGQFFSCRLQRSLCVWGHQVQAITVLGLHAEDLAGSLLNETCCWESKQPGLLPESRVTLVIFDPHTALGKGAENTLVLVLTLEVDPKAPLIVCLNHPQVVGVKKEAVIGLGPLSSYYAACSFWN